MPSDRIQRQVDRLLDSAEQAFVDRDWALLAELASDALSLDPDSGDAQGFADAAHRNLGTPEETAVPSPAPPQPAAPSSFVGGRYEVREFLGEGAVAETALDTLEVATTLPVGDRALKRLLLDRLSSRPSCWANASGRVRWRQHE